MKKNIWKNVSLGLIGVLVIFIFYFLIKGLFQINVISLSDLKYRKTDILNNLLMTDNTTRKFKNNKLKLDQLSEVLWAGYGKTVKNKRTVFSLLNFPLNLYLCIDNNDVDHLKQGFYVYKPNNHKLKKIESRDLKKNLCKILKLSTRVPGILLISANDVAYQKDKEKVYLETGQVIAQILLKMKQLELKVRFIDDFEIVKLIDALNMKQDIPIMVFLIGE
ncbi:MAG: nitroreductase family protein [Spirochaetes bacterium]|nr:nitroreductase family protein [Spirochaetota bacterium]